MRPYLQYLKYCFASKYRHGYGIHSPYVYHLVTTIIEEELPYYKYSLVESIREKMQRVEEKIGLFDDSGHKKLYGVKRLVERHSIPAKYGQLLFRLVNHYKPTSIVEYGATCGISTMYMAAPNSKTPVFAITKQRELADLAKTYEDRVEMRNIKHFAVNDLRTAYESLLAKLPERDFLYVNTAEVGEVKAAVEQRLCKDEQEFFMVLPNVYATQEMRNLWSELKADPRVKVSIDIFEHGMLIASPDLQKGNYILRY